MFTKKKKRISSFALSVLVLASTNLNVSYAKGFKDIETVSKWAIKDVIKARDLNLLEKNEYLAPKEAIKRGEFVRLLILSLGVEINNDEKQIFSDVNKDNKYFNYINSSYKNKLVMGNGDLFNPDKSITRQEMAVIIDRVLKLDKTQDIKFEDNNDISEWAKDSVSKVAKNKIIMGSGNKFNPKDTVSKEMAVVIAMRVKDFSKSIVIEEKNDIKSEKTVEVKDTINYLMTTNDNPTVGSMAGDWSILGIARSSEKLDEKYFDTYYKNVEDYVKAKEGNLHRIKYTEYSRLILSLTSIGKDPQNIGGYNLVKPLTDFDTVVKQGINGPIWALIAVDSKNYNFVEDSTVKNQTTREKLINFILERQIADGGWNLGQNPEKSDIDITAMAIQSLSNYYGKRDDVKNSVDKAIEFLSKSQKEDGSFTSWDSKNSESIAQVIVATTSIGINPNEDLRFIKNGKSPIDAILGFKDNTGGFYHIKAGETGNGGGLPGMIDIMATDQGLYAIVSYNRLLEDKPALYNMNK